MLQVQPKTSGVGEVMAASEGGGGGGGGACVSCTAKTRERTIRAVMDHQPGMEICKFPEAAVL